MVAATLARPATLDNSNPLRQAQTDIKVAARYIEIYMSLADKVESRAVPPGQDFSPTPCASRSASARSGRGTL